jgi:drug/metabolite transporter (DMT)-like permease
MHRPASTRKAISPQTANALPIIALICGNLALAFGPWFVRLTDVGPVAAGFWRMALAVPILVALAFAGQRRPFAAARACGGRSCWAASPFRADLASWHLGILKTTLANATLFGNSATLMFPIYGFFVARAWPTKTQGLALALAAAGAACCSAGPIQLSPKHLAGDLLCLLAGTLYTVYFVLMAKARAAMAPMPALALSTLASVLPLLIAALRWARRSCPSIGES